MSGAKKMDKKTKKIIPFTILSILLIVILFSINITAEPVGPTITHISNETSVNVGIGTVRANDLGGYITTINLFAAQQDFGWKAYVGNITGKLVLEDSQNYSIYDWSLSNPNAEVYISRNQTVAWSTVNCSNRSVILSEDTALTKTSTATDSINKTFNETRHKTFTVAGRTMLNSTCPAIATYVGANETRQTNAETNLFQEILLADANGFGNTLVYTAIAEIDGLGFNNNSYDFQAIVPDDETAGTTNTYYFYVELG